MGRESCTCSPQRKLLALSCCLQFEISCTAHFWTKNLNHVQTRAAIKNYRTDRVWIRVSEAAQKDNLYHISRAQYTMSSVRYIFHIYTTRQIKLFQPLSPFVPPTSTNSIKWWYTCMQHWNCMEGLLSPHHFSVHYLIHSTTKVLVLMRTGRSVGLQKGHITNLWQYGGKQPPSSEYRPSSSGLSGQHRQLHQAHHIWLWRWSCKRLSQESTEPHSTP
jgi:hypothetical protein